MQAKSIYASKQEHPYTYSSSKKLINSAVKTSALLFYKPNYNSSQKTRQQQGNMFGFEQTRNHAYSNSSYHSCQNHPSTVAKYMTNNDQQELRTYHCQKCALLLNQQGFDILPIPSSNQSSIYSQQNRLKSNSKNMKLHNCSQSFPFPERQPQINDFLTKLSTAKQQISQTTNQAREILISSQQFYGQQIEQINDYFQNIIQSLQLQKNKCYNYILLQRQNAEKETRSLVKKLTEGEKQITSMISDIEQNLDSVYSINWQNYKLVMETFHSRMQDATKILLEVKQIGIPDVEYRKIEFAGVPQSINSLSQIIIQNSYGSFSPSVQENQGSLLLTEGSNSSIKNQQRRQFIEHNIHRRQTSIFQKLKTDYSDDSCFQHPNNLMFSFDGEKMKEVVNSLDSFKENTKMPINMNMPLFSNNDPEIYLKKNKQFSEMLSKGEKVQKVEGIKEVEEIDVLVMDDDFIDMPCGGFSSLRMAR